MISWSDPTIGLRSCPRFVKPVPTWLALWQPPAWSPTIGTCPHECSCYPPSRTHWCSSRSPRSAYPFLLRLHALQEVERAAQLLDCSPSERSAKVAQWRWGERLQLATPSFRLREPVLALRACILRIFEMGAEESKLWLQVGMCHGVWY